MKLSGFRANWRDTNLKIAVIGGYGRMGRWFTRYFASHGHKVVISGVRLQKAKAFAEEAGVNFAKNNVEAVKDVDLVMVSVPIPTTPRVIDEIVTHVKKGAVISEISSLKSGVVKALVEAAKLKVRPLSLHPLFGPGAQKLRGRKIAVVPILNAEAEKTMAKELFPEAETVVVDAEEHDRVMALVLSLPHFMNVVFASVIGEENLETLKRLEGTTFTLQLTLAESVMTEDPSLQATIQMDNKYVSRYLDDFLSKAETVKKWIADKDVEKFTGFCDHVENLLSKDMDFSEAYKKMYKVLEIIE